MRHPHDFQVNLEAKPSMSLVSVLLLLKAESPDDVERVFADIRELAINGHLQVFGREKSFERNWAEPAPRTPIPKTYWDFNRIETHRFLMDPTLGQLGETENLKFVGANITHADLTYYDIYFDAGQVGRQWPKPKAKRPTRNSTVKRNRK